VIAVVDTNVPVIANGKSPQASPECVVACVERLQQLLMTGRLVLDDGRRIIREYQANLRSGAQPGFGDAFLKWVLTNHTNPARCERITIHEMSGPAEDYREFPNDLALAFFDPADRKFVAVALAHREHPPIWVAVERDWWNFRNPLADAGVGVEFLCEDDMKRLLRTRRSAR